MSLICLIIVLSGLGRDVEKLLKTSSCHAGTVGLAAFTSRDIARQRWTAFTAGVDGRKLRWPWSRGVSRRRSTLLLHNILSLNLDWSDRWSVWFIFFFKYPYF